MLSNSASNGADKEATDAMSDIHALGRIPQASRPGFDAACNTKSCRRNVMSSCEDVKKKERKEQKESKREREPPNFPEKISRERPRTSFPLFSLCFLFSRELIRYSKPQLAEVSDHLAELLSSSRCCPF